MSAFKVYSISSLLIFLSSVHSFFVYPIFLYKFYIKLEDKSNANSFTINNNLIKAGGLILVYELAKIFNTFITKKLMEKLHVNFLLFISLIITSIFNFLFAFAETYKDILILRVLLGIFYSLPVLTTLFLDENFQFKQSSRLIKLGQIFPMITIVLSFVIGQIRNTTINTKQSFINNLFEFKLAEQAPPILLILVIEIITIILLIFNGYVFFGSNRNKEDFQIYHENQKNNNLQKDIDIKDEENLDTSNKGNQEKSKRSLVLFTDNSKSKKSDSDNIEDVNDVIDKDENAEGIFYSDENKNIDHETKERKKLNSNSNSLDKKYQNIGDISDIQHPSIISKVTKKENKLTCERPMNINNENNENENENLNDIKNADDITDKELQIVILENKNNINNQNNLNNNQNNLHYKNTKFKNQIILNQENLNENLNGNEEHEEIDENTTKQDYINHMSSKNSTTNNKAENKTPQSFKINNKLKYSINVKDLTSENKNQHTNNNISSKVYNNKEINKKSIQNIQSQNSYMISFIYTIIAVNDSILLNLFLIIFYIKLYNILLLSLSFCLVYSLNAVFFFIQISLSLNTSKNQFRIFSILSLISCICIVAWLFILEIFSSDNTTSKDNANPDNTYTNIVWFIGLFLFTIRCMCSAKTLLSYNILITRSENYVLQDKLIKLQSYLTLPIKALSAFVLYALNTIYSNDGSASASTTSAYDTNNKINGLIISLSGLALLINLYLIKKI